MDKEILALLSRARRRLNRVILLHRAALWAIPGTFASGIFTATLRFVGAPSATFALWAVLSMTAAAAGAIAARSRLLDERGVARWIDVRLRADDIFQAAQFCIRGGSTGRFDGEIVRRAALLAPRAAELRPPLKPLAKRVGTAAAAAVLGAYAIFLAAPIDSVFPGFSGGADSAAPPELGGAMRAAMEEGGRAAEEFAASLFPEDKRMAVLAERALREGRLDDLREILDAAGLRLDSELSRALGELERRKLTMEKEGLARAMTALALRRPSEGSGGDEPRDERGERGGAPEGNGLAPGDSARGDSAPEALDRGGAPSGEEPGEADADDAVDGTEDAEIPQTREDGERSGRPSSPGTGRDGDRAAPSLSDAGEDGGGAGVGEGRRRGGGTVESEAEGGEARIAESRDPTFFELILPGEKIATPIGEIAPSPRKSAESAQAREVLPLEYEDFLRSYFMTLQQGEGR